MHMFQQGGSSAYKKNLIRILEEFIGRILHEISEYTFETTVKEIFEGILTEYDWINF